MVWLSRTRPHGSYPAAALALLSPQERDRARVYRRPIDREQFLISHLLLRRALCETFGRRPADWTIVRDTHGRWSAEGRTNLDFSLTHCDDAVAVAVVVRGRVGIDLEKVSDVNPQEIDHLFSKEEASACVRPDDWIRRWAVKEAYAKYVGDCADLDFSSIKIERPELTVESRPLEIGGIAHQLARVADAAAVLPPLNPTMVPVESVLRF